MTAKETRYIEKNKSSEVLISLIIIAVFFFSINIRRWLVILGASFLNEGSPAGQLVIGYLFWIVPTLLTLLIIYQYDFKKVFSELGLDANAWKAILFAFLVTLPMMIGYFLLTRKASGDLSTFLKEAFLPGVMEEYIFRGFLIGQLFKRGRLGFIPAVLIGSLAFGLGHLYQGGSFWETLGIVAVTSFGSAWFAWLFFEWGRNLYLVMALHLFMNLWWTIFGAGQNALGDATANIYRFITVAITVLITIMLSRKTGFRVRGRDLFSAP